MQQTSLSLLETCKKFSEMFCPLKLGCPGRSQEGSLLISAVVILLVVSVFALIALSLTASGQFQSASTTMSLQAFYTAESGLRYAAVKYLQQENTGGLVDENDKSADDEKALYIENLDGMTIDLPEGRGSLSFQVFGYWFVVKDNNGIYQLDMPGRRPPNFIIPYEQGTLSFGDTLGAPDTMDYTNGVVDADGVLTYGDGPSQAQLASWVGQSAYLTFKMNRSNSATEVYLPLEANRALPSAALIEVDNQLITYDYYHYNEDGGQLLLRSTYDPISLETVRVNNEIDKLVVLKKTIILQVVSSIGDGGYSQKVNYTITIGDSAPDKVEELVLTDGTLDAFDPPPDNEASEETLSTGPLPGADAVDAIWMTNLTEQSAGETSDYCQGSAIFVDTAKINEYWDAGKRLDYDIQMKLATGAMNYGAQGVEFRKKYVKNAPDGTPLFQGYGLSFMKFYSPSIVFADGVQEISPGDWIYYQGTAVQSGGAWDCSGSSVHLMARAQVDGILDFQGSWISGTAQGRLLLKNHTLEKLVPCAPDTFFNPEHPIIDDAGTVLATATVVDISPEGFNDHIPDSLKPPGMGSWFHGDINYTSAAEIEAMDALVNNEGARLLLVLWQQHVNGDIEERRWLAYKDMTHDSRIQGKQDSEDGRIFHDSTGLMLRIREQGIGEDKVNEIEVFYSDGDDSINNRTKNMLCFDYGSNRMGYLPGYLPADDTDTLPTPIWPPQRMGSWGEDDDYFTHLEKPVDQSLSYGFQWDVIASNKSPIESWDGDGQAVLSLEDDGRIIASDFTTPDVGSYEVNEFALSGHFDGTREIVYDHPGAPLPAALLYYDAAVQFIVPGHSTGGFLTATQY